MKTNSIKITPLQWYAGVAEEMRNKLFLKIITPMEYYEKLTESLEIAMKQEKQQKMKTIEEHVVDEECPMNNLIDRLTKIYPSVSSNLDLNVDFEEKVPNIFQQYRHAFKKHGIIMDIYHSKNDTFYYTLAYKDFDFYSSKKEYNYDFELTAQMACIEKAFELCNEKIDDFYKYGESLGISINDLQRLKMLSKKII